MLPIEYPVIFERVLSFVISFFATWDPYNNWAINRYHDHLIIRKKWHSSSVVHLSAKCAHSFWFNSNRLWFHLDCCFYYAFVFHFYHFLCLCDNKAFHIVHHENQTNVNSFFLLLLNSFYRLKSDERIKWCNVMHELHVESLNK